jgi:hypothetical protein
MPRLLLLVIGLALAGAGCAKPPEPPRTAHVPDAMLMMRMTAAPEVVPPIRKPPVKVPSEVTLPDDFPVVGVVAGGKARAYSRKALAAGDGHVVNDLLGDVPVSLVYCDVSESVHAFTHDSRGSPLDVGQAGHFPDGLMVRYQGGFYSPRTGKPPSGDGPVLPLRRQAFEETTWKKWREKHPGTEIYVGPDALPLGPDK